MKRAFLLITPLIISSFVIQQSINHKSCDINLKIDSWENLSDSSKIYLYSKPIATFDTVISTTKDGLILKFKVLTPKITVPKGSYLTKNNKDSLLNFNVVPKNNKSFINCGDTLHVKSFFNPNNPFVKYLKNNGTLDTIPNLK